MVLTRSPPSPAPPVGSLRAPGRRHATSLARSGVGQGRLFQPPSPAPRPASPVEAVGRGEDGCSQGVANVYLIDASPYVFRAFFSLPDSITTPDGAPANAVYGFASFLARLAAEERPSHLAIAFDGSLTTSFRNELYPAYKAQRALPPAELEAQLAACREVAAAFGVAVFIDDRYEADDILASLVERLGGSEGDSGPPIVVVSHDKDLAQLVGERVTFFDFAKGERFGPEEVRAKFGVRPEQLVDLLALCGDTVDNIPGVPGVGAKTAAVLLAHFRDVDDLYDRLDEVAGLPIRGAAGLAARLDAHREAARLALSLVRLATDVPLVARIHLDDLAWPGPNRRRVDELFDRLGFDTLRERFAGAGDRRPPGAGSPTDS